MRRPRRNLDSVRYLLRRLDMAVEQLPASEGRAELEQAVEVVRETYANVYPPGTTPERAPSKVPARWGRPPAKFCSTCGQRLPKRTKK